MNAIELKMMRGMIDILNEASKAYYSGNPIMSDSQFDARLNDLQELEKETGIIYSNSPSINVGAKVLSSLPEVEHNHLMLSLEKCHTPQEIIDFSNGKCLIASIKCDGMTASLLYEDGVFVRGESRGNGHVGNDITEHIKRFLNVPMKINKTGTYIVDGECIITDEDFAEVNRDNEFKNSRNLIAGTLSSLDTSVVSQRKAKFIAWDVIEGGNSNSFADNLSEAAKLGFSVVPYWSAINLDSKKLQNTLDYIFEFASDEGLPCDGIVFKFDDIEYGKSLGATSHHFKNGIAYKKEDDIVKTELIGIDWTIGKSGQITPTAVFKPVELLGSTVERASVHNISILTNLDLHTGDIIEIAKANAIIPQVKRNISADERMALGKESDYIIIPTTCPVCGGNTEIKQDNDSKVLICTNENCKGKLLGKLTHFVSKNAMNVDGMSEATLEFLIKKGWVSSFKDIYKLDYYREVWKDYDGFGDKSVDKLLDSIETSKSTTLDRFIYALSIPLIGRSASKTIAKYCKYDIMNFINSYTMGIDWTILNDFGENMSNSIKKYIAQNSSEIIELCECLTFVKPEINNNNKLFGKTFVITGSLNHFANRDEVKEKIEAAGGKVSGSVSAKTSYLVCNEESGSSKYKKAKELGIEVISEEKLIEILN